jgi:hypothetical protein
MDFPQIVILSGAPHRSIAGNSACGAESKNPGGAHRTNALQAFSTTEPEHKIFRPHA